MKSETLCNLICIYKFFFFSVIYYKINEIKFSLAKVLKTQLREVFVYLFFCYVLFESYSKFLFVLQTAMIIGFRFFIF